MKRPPNNALPWVKDLAGTETRPAVVVGSGSSLADFDFTQLDDDRFITIVINHQAIMNQDKYSPDWWIFSDRRFTNGEFASFPLDPKTKVAVYTFVVSSIEKRGQVHGYPSWWKQSHQWTVYNADPENGLFQQTTTALPACELARVLGCPKIALLGIDCSRHYYFKHPLDKSAEPELEWSGFVKAWQGLQNYWRGKGIGVPITNCSVLSYDRTNPIMPWEEWLASLDDKGENADALDSRT